MNGYQKQAHESSILIDRYRLTPNQIYAGIGASNEMGEVAGLIKKAICGDYGDNPTANPVFLDKLRKELGDSVWYIVELCTLFGFDLDDIIEKLKQRMKNGTILGSGDR